MEHLGTVTIKFFVSLEEGKVESIQEVDLDPVKGKTFLGVSARAGTMRELQQFCGEVAKDPNMLKRLFNLKK